MVVHAELQIVLLALFARYLPIRGNTRKVHARSAAEYPFPFRYSRSMHRLPRDHRLVVVHSVHVKRGIDICSLKTALDIAALGNGDHDRDEGLLVIPFFGNRICGLSARTVRQCPC
jgi:hypothetical protein